MGDEEDEDEVEYRGGIVMKTVIESPRFAQSVEYLVFDLPALVSDAAELAGGDEGLGDGGCPEPGRGNLLLNPFARGPLAPGFGLFGA